MNNKDFVFDLSARSIDKVVDDVRRFLKEERGIDMPENRVREGMADVLCSKLDMLAEDLREMFTSPGREEVRELERFLASHRAKPVVAENSQAAQLPIASAERGVFSGNVNFSAEKLGVMMEYILGKGRTIYKTNLNKLLFYADLTAFYLRGSGISGSVYLNRPFGPVADPAAGVLNGLIESGRVTVAERTKHFITSAPRSELLHEEDKKVLDWVLDTYGEMGAGELSELSHMERAYKDTRPNEPIAYAYAQFFKRLPPKELLR